MISNQDLNHKGFLWRLFGKNSLSESQNKTLKLFLYIIFSGTFAAMLGIILYYVYALAAKSNGSQAFDWLLGIFSDFIAIMSASLSDSPYGPGGASYPPIAIIVLYPFAIICKDVFAIYEGLPLTIDELTSRVVLHKEFWIAMSLFWIICSICVILAITCKYRFGVKNSLKIAIIILLASPFVFAVMRGNTIYFALIFLLLFLLLYEHKNPWIRELSYICLVIAGAIKIYPLFFGVFLLHKKKFFASFRIAFYSVILFCVSFLLFESGLGDIGSFIQNLGGFASDNTRLLETNNLSITSLLYKLFYVISPSLATSRFFTITNISILVLVFLISSVAASICRSNFSRSVISSAVVILIPSVSYFYVLSFAIIPFMEFINNYDKFSSKKQWLYKILFSFMFFTPFIIAKNFIVHAIAVLIMLSVELYSVIKETKKTCHK